jgi:Ca2+-transporting ATPase
MSEVEERQLRLGPNRLKRAERRSALSIWVDQFKNIIVLLLAAAAGLSFAFGELVEGLAVVAVIFLNALIGFFTELRAVRSMEALRELGRVESKVRRDGTIHTVPADEIVPGDVLVIKSGDLVTADARLFMASRLQADESTLTGESVPVEKGTDALEKDTSLAERSNLVFKGTAVTRGSGEGIVVATGMDTELGNISSLVQEAEQEVTPLEQRLDQLGQKLVWVTLAIAAGVAVIGILIGRDVLLILESSIALAVAAVPEGLPIVATIALARGMQRMAHRNALIRQLSAVETLGSTTVILTDKTGTLTENEMTLEEIAIVEGEAYLQRRDGSRPVFKLNDEELRPEDHPALKSALQIGVLCNNAEIGAGSGDGDEDVGDPLEIALLRAAKLVGVDREELLDRYPETRELAFDPEIKMMATIHRTNGRQRVAVKGAPQAVMQASSRQLAPEGPEPLDDRDRQRWRQRMKALGLEGYRVLALAEKTVEDERTDPYHGLIFIGVVCLLDPAREDVQAAIEACKDAGVRVVMVTGDQSQTAKNIAERVHLVKEDEPDVVSGQEIPEGEERADPAEWTAARVFARVNPGQKLELVSAFQAQGEIVAMTGDGVNDAPALKKADIGIAMGRRGTQVAKEAADMVLKDDAFSSIVVAIEHGRVIFENIRKFVVYLLSCNVSEILVVSLASFASAPLPLRPLQILFLNLVTDVFPALALGVGEGNPGMMRQPPRDPEEPVINRGHWGSIAGYALMISASVLGAFTLSLSVFEFSTTKAITIAFLTLASAQLWNVFNMRSLDTGLVRNEITTNPFIWGALGLCVGLLLAAVYLPILAELLGTTHPGLSGWGLVIVMSLAPVVLGQLLKAQGWGEA